MNEYASLACLVNDYVLKLLRVLVRHCCSCQPIVASTLLLKMIFTLLCLIEIERIQLSLDATWHTLLLYGLVFLLSTRVEIFGQGLGEHGLLIHVSGAGFTLSLFVCF